MDNYITKNNQECETNLNLSHKEKFQNPAKDLYGKSNQYLLSITIKQN